MSFKRNNLSSCVLSPNSVKLVKDYPLSFEQDKYLKKQLFQYVIHSELDFIKSHPSLGGIEDTQYIGFFYKKFIREFPLVKDQNKDFWGHIDSFLKKIQEMRLSNSDERGKRTQTDKIFSKTEKIAVVAFRNMVKTPISAQEPKKNKLGEELDAAANDISAEDREQQKRIEQFVVLLEKFVTDLVENGGGKVLFDTIRTTDSFEDLPSHLKELVDFGSVICSHGLYKKFHVDAKGPKQLKSLKTMNNLIPFQAVSLLMKVANPIKVMKGVLDLFLARPFGTKSLAQRMVGIFLNQKEGEEEELQQQNDIIDTINTIADVESDEIHISSVLSRKDVIHKLNNSTIVDKIHNYINRDVSLLPPRYNEIHETPVDKVRQAIQSDIEPVLQSDFFSTMSPSDIAYTYILMQQEVRIRDFNQISSFLGDDEVISTIKEVMSVFFQPLTIIYQQADISALLSSISSLIKHIVDAADTKGTPEETIANYKVALDKFSLDFYVFLNKMVVADYNGEGLLRDLTDWLVAQVVFFKKNSSPVTVNLMQIIETHLNSEEREALFKELDALCIYNKELAEQRKIKIQKLLASGKDVTKPPKNQNILFDDYLSEDDMHDINYGDDLDDLDDDFSSSSESDPTTIKQPMKKLVAPETKTIEKLVEPFKTLVDHHILAPLSK